MAEKIKVHIPTISSQSIKFRSQQNFITEMKTFTTFSPMRKQMTKKLEIIQPMGRQKLKIRTKNLETIQHMGRHKVNQMIKNLEIVQRMDLGNQIKSFWQVQKNLDKGLMNIKRDPNRLKRDPNRHQIHIGQNGKPSIAS